MKFFSIKLIPFLIAISIFQYSFSQINNNPTEKELQIRLDSLFENLSSKGMFNGNILVAKNDNIIYQREFGFARGDFKTKLESTDRFNIGSIYKEIPAISILQLMEKGKINLSDPLNKYLNDLPDWSNQITILNLLQYTSGLPKVNWMKHKSINDTVLYDDIKCLENLSFSPGSSYLYTNNSPFLLSKIVEKISKKAFVQYVKQNILDKLNLNQTRYSLSFPYKDFDSIAVAFNENYLEDSPPFTIETPLFLYTTTINDQIKLLNGIHNLTLISKKSLILGSKIPVLDLKNLESSFGNLKVDKEGNIEHFHHGSSGNYESTIYKNKDITIILMTNRKNENLHFLNEEIIKIIK
ncbi:CubicO group peptidase, beta-lactamase class C family [Nonlabens sp. Hel1_33_55]|uniref:serine hydrolase domain-containing protein n=1 Tax=Nonlabens sp. Hel1_33_55 TaxID=1336802 RepID=UPI000875C238|nr:serine hydrolase domain-containing protein [Nonlabens sp. Hel1_33_55]SCY00081.1 CubicO group peptidase, beta-lactamase class C family [Nonlabens sp. Hel1_33_55]